MQLVLFMLRSPALMPGLPELVYQTSEKNYAQLQAQLLQLVQSMMGGDGRRPSPWACTCRSCAPTTCPSPRGRCIETQGAWPSPPNCASALLRTGLGYLDNCRAWNVQPVARPAVSSR